MSERTTILRNQNTSTGITTELPKTGLGLLLNFLAIKFNAVSNFVHKWAKP